MLRSFMTFSLFLEKSEEQLLIVEQYFGENISNANFLNINKLQKT